MINIKDISLIICKPISQNFTVLIPLVIIAVGIFSFPGNTLAAAPNSPTSVRTLATGANTVSLSWNAPVGASPSVTDYIIEYKATSSSSWLTFNDGISTATTTSVTGLSSSTVYNFRVSAVNSDGTSSPSSISSSLYPEIASIPNLISFWDFSESAGGPYIAKAGTQAFALSNAGGTNVGQVASGPFSGSSASFNGSSQYLKIPAASVGDLNLSQFGNNVTVFSVVNRNESDTGFIAGIWQEDNADPRRQYGLFTSLPTYGGDQEVGGHVSKTGGVTPGYPYNRDYAANVSTITNNTWKFIAMTYNGSEIRSYYDSRFEPRPTYTEPGTPTGQGLTYSKNPYVFTDGLNNTAVGDFTVGSVKLTAGMDNYFTGQIGGVGVVAGALSPASIFAIQRTIARINGTPAYTYDFYNTAANNTATSFSTRGMINLFGTNGTDVSTSTSLLNGFVLFNTSGNQFVLRQSTSSAGPSFWYDDQMFGIPISDLHHLSLRLNDDSTADSIKLAVKVGTQWYASEQSFSVTGTGASSTDWTTAETKTLTFERAGSRWQKMTVTPGSVLSVSTTTESVDLSSDSLINAVGVYSPSKPTGNVRFDDLQINTVQPNQSAPVNITAATTTGAVVLGTTITAYPGTWTGSPVPTFTYQWIRNGVDIAGETGVSHVLGASDAGSAVSVRVTATNSVGSASSVSLVTASAPSLTLPSNSVLPTLSGSFIPGAIVTTSTGTWSGSLPTTYTYQWQRAGVNIVGATSSSYTVTSDDIGFALHSVVTATNLSASVSAQSADTAVSIAWSPLNLGTALQAWFDASDASTFTLSSSTVVTWSDKSQNGRNLTAGQ